jgi:hypothetical protein
VGQCARRRLLAFLNTAGGHENSACAVSDALRDPHGDMPQVDLVDVTAEYLLWPLSGLSAIYNQLVRLHGWPLGAHLPLHQRSPSCRVAQERLVAADGEVQSETPLRPSSRCVCLLPSTTEGSYRASAGGAQRRAQVSVSSEKVGAAQFAQRRTGPLLGREGSWNCFVLRNVGGRLA